MKRILPFLFVLIGYNSTAQLVNIPDANFKTFLVNHLPQIDLNSDGQIQQSEAAGFTGSLNIPPNAYVADLTGVEAFTGINSLMCGGLTLTTFNPSGLTNLHDININGSNLTSLDLSALTGLTTMWLDANQQLASVNVTGLVNLTSFNCMNNLLTALDVSSLTNLTSLNCTHNAIGSLNVNGLAHLTTLYCQDNNMASFSISNCPQLSYLNCGNTTPTPGNSNHFTSLDLSNGLGGLTTVYCSGGFLTTLNLTGCSNLQNLTCGANQLTNLDLTSCTSLQNLTCQSNQLTSLNVPGFSSLQSINCSQNALTNINITGCTAITYFDFTGNQVATIDVSNHPALWYLSCGGNQLSSIDISTLTGLLQFIGFQNSLTSIDISGCPALTHLDCRFNPLTYANLKNGPGLPSLYLMDINSLQYVCVDDNEVSAVQNYFIQNIMPNVNVNSYCSFTPGGSFNTLNGTVRVDADNNGCTGSDPTLPGMMMKINDGTETGSTFSNASGIYTFYANAGNFTVTPQTQVPYYTVSPASATINFTGTGTTQSADFCLIPNGIHNDLDITLIPVTAARPGFTATYKLIFQNKGTQVLSGNVDLHFDDAKMDLITSIPAATTQTTGSLVWAYINLQPFESRTIDMHFHLLPPPINNINDTLSFTNNIAPLAGDETPIDNSFELRQVVTGSFDPNDKACLEGATFDITRVGDYAHYVIRFQNMGTADAENIVVKDLLENSFDWSSLKITSTSHPCFVKQTLGNKVEFIFEGINLPPASVDEPGSHGYIAFKIKTIPSLVIGDSLKNTAAIYFDFNLPVITNMAGSVVDSIRIVPISIEYLKGSIQSGKHLLNWKANCTSIQATFTIERSVDARKYNSIGSITASNTRCLQPFDFIDNNPVAGINYYRIKMTDIDGKISYSSTIALLNKKSGFEIVSLLSNPVVGGTALLNITSAEKQSINIVVSDASGKIVQAIDQSIISGFTQIKMNFANLAAGIYTITIYTANGERKTKQFIRQ